MTNAHPRRTYPGRDAGLPATATSSRTWPIPRHVAAPPATAAGRRRRPLSDVRHGPSRRRAWCRGWRRSAPRPPRCCAVCRAALPWTRDTAGRRPDRPAALERLLRRLPRAIRQCAGDRESGRRIRVEDERDLEDLLRACCPCTSTTFGRRDARRTTPPACERLPPRAGADRRRGQGRRPPTLGTRLAEQLKEDAAYYRAAGQPRPHGR